MEKNNRFKTVYKEGNNFKPMKMIFIDQETGINYLFIKYGYGGGLTPLLDVDGNPVITPIK